MADQKLSQHATAPSIISDQEAREIAGRSGTNAGSWNDFCRTGEISAFFADLATRRLGTAAGRLAPFGMRGAVSADDARALYAYVAHHGERGPVDSWGER